MRYDYAWCRRLAALIEQGHENPVRQLQTEYTVPLKKIKAYLKLTMAAIKDIEAKNATKEEATASTQD